MVIVSLSCHELVAGSYTTMETRSKLIYGFDFSQYTMPSPRRKGTASVTVVLEADQHGKSYPMSIRHYMYIIYSISLC